MASRLPLEAALRHDGSVLTYWATECMLTSVVRGVTLQGHCTATSSRSRGPSPHPRVLAFARTRDRASTRLVSCRCTNPYAVLLSAIMTSPDATANNLEIDPNNKTSYIPVIYGRQLPRLAVLHLRIRRHREQLEDYGLRVEPLANIRSQHLSTICLHSVELTVASRGDIHHAGIHTLPSRSVTGGLVHSA